MSKPHHYAASLVWTGSARGPTSAYAAYSREYAVEFAGKPSMRGSADATFRGDAALYNPEDLLMAALSACHMLSYLADAARAGLLVLAYEDSATGTMITEKNGGHFTEVILRPHVTVAAGSDTALALRLHDSAHHGCFIASSVNFPVRCEPQTTVASTA